MDAARLVGRIGDPWTSLELRGLLTPELLGDACAKFAKLDARVKIRLLCAPAVLRRADAAALADSLRRLLDLADGDSDAWVRTMARLVRPFFPNGSNNNNNNDNDNDQGNEGDTNNNNDSNNNDNNKDDDDDHKGGAKRKRRAPAVESIEALLGQVRALVAERGTPRVFPREFSYMEESLVREAVERAGEPTRHFEERAPKMFKEPATIFDERRRKIRVVIPSSKPAPEAGSAVQSSQRLASGTVVGVKKRESTTPFQPLTLPPPPPSSRRAQEEIEILDLDMADQISREAMELKKARGGSAKGKKGSGASGSRPETQSERLRREKAEELALRKEEREKKRAQRLADALAGKRPNPNDDDDDDDDDDDGQPEPEPEPLTLQGLIDKPNELCPEDLEEVQTFLDGGRVDMVDGSPLSREFVLTRKDCGTYEEILSAEIQYDLGTWTLKQVRRAKIVQ